MADAVSAFDADRDVDRIGVPTRAAGQDGADPGGRTPGERPRDGPTDMEDERQRIRAPKEADIGERIAIDDDHLRSQSRLERARGSLDPESGGRPDRRGADRVDRTKASTSGPVSCAGSGSSSSTERAPVLITFTEAGGVSPMTIEPPEQSAPSCSTS
jgi:hypothetical protein